MIIWWSALFSLTASDLPLFFNYDCVDLKTRKISWDEVHSSLKEAASSESDVALDISVLNEVFGRNHDVYFSDCPIGTLALGLLQAFRYQAAGNASDTAELFSWVRMHFDTLPWYIVAQSRWPVFELLLNYFDQEFVAEDISDLTCCSVESGIMEWPLVLSAGQAFVQDNGGRLETAEFIGHLSNTLFSMPNAVIDQAMEECMCAVVFLAVIQSLSAAARLSQHFPSWAKIVHDFLRFVPFRVYINEWPLAEVLIMFADLNKGDKFISYSASGDKLRRRYSDLVPEVADALRGKPDSEFLKKAIPVIKKAAMPLVIHGEYKRQVVAYTMVYGSKWTSLISRAVERFSRVNMKKVLFVTLGEEAKTACEEISSRSKKRTSVYCLLFPSPHNSQIHRYTAAHVILQTGVDAFYFDLDTFFFQSPLPAIAATLTRQGLAINARSAEKKNRFPSFLISSHADGNCVNVGFFYVMAETASREFLTIFIDWYHRHAYEIDQRGMDAFLGHSKTIGASFIPPRIRGGEDELVMHYAILDDVNQFIIPGVGWYGDSSKVVVAHYCEWDFDRKMADLNFLFTHPDAEIQTFFDKYKLSAPKERLKCW